MNRPVKWYAHAGTRAWKNGTMGRRRGYACSMALRRLDGMQIYAQGASERIRNKWSSTRIIITAMIIELFHVDLPPDLPAEPMTRCGTVWVRNQAFRWQNSMQQIKYQIRTTVSSPLPVDATFGATMISTFFFSTGNGNNISLQYSLPITFKPWYKLKCWTRNICSLPNLNVSSFYKIWCFTKVFSCMNNIVQKWT